MPKISMDHCSYMSKNMTNTIFLKPTNEYEILLMYVICHLPKVNFQTTSKWQKLFPYIRKMINNYFVNYRPISILPAFSKILVKFSYKRIVDFLDKYDILCKVPFGLRKGLNRFGHPNISIKVLRHYRKNEYMVGIFLDLSRAFDTRKLCNYGIRGTH